MIPLTFTSGASMRIFVLVLLFWGCGQAEKKIEKAKQIKVGMSKQQLVEIMEEPDLADTVDAFAPFVERYYYKVYGIEIFSDPIIVWFDSTGHVGMISFPKDIENI